MSRYQELKKYLNSGEPYIWLTSSALALCLILLIGLVSLIAINGFSGFWPREIYELNLHDGNRVLAELKGAENIDGDSKLKIKRANRDDYGLDFAWLSENEIRNKNLNSEVIVLERYEWGPYYGYPVKLITNSQKEVNLKNEKFNELLDHELNEVLLIKDKIRSIEEGEMKLVGARQDRLQIRKQKLIKSDKYADNRKLFIENKEKLLRERFDILEENRQDLSSQLKSQLFVSSPSSDEKIISLANIESYYYPNKMSWFEKFKLYSLRIFKFVWENPREANTEGGVFPAIFGTVMLVIIMSIVVTPLGVLAAIYLHEYAKPGLFVSLVRIAVNNLAGVPSIVFGVFGVGFFIYFLGGNIDRIFFSESLPSPTFGTGGIFWASLTLALLTVPTVIVAAEEGLSAIPKHMREASYALGATKFETMWRVILPALSPAILTGVILAVARAAGEVAPLMITGVVKIAPDLPIDMVAPFFHVERKFMHLGFHIYDLGFQSPNVDAARPYVYATTLLLIVLVVFLNLTAIIIRNRLNKKLQVGTI
jgi:phosphate transport system permease protein